MPRGRPRKNQGDALMASAELIGWAIGGLEREISQTKERLASLTAQAAKLRARAGTRIGRPPAVSATAEEVAEPAQQPGRKRRRRKMSPEARKRISEMMTKRWAERRKGK
jgi:hypothetical protein